MNIKDQILGEGEYYKDIVKKDTIFIHHTAGGHRPDWTISAWDKDDDTTTKKPRVVGTQYVIGGKSITDGNTDFDGVVYRALDDKFWIHHLGTTFANNKLLNQKCIGIEVCNYGQLTCSKDGIFLNYVNKQVPADQVCTLATPFRGFKYYHKYTDKQIAALKELILQIKQTHPSISLKNILTTPAGFEFNADACAGKPGIWSHTSVRKDKNDMCPQPNLLAMLATLNLV